MAYIKPGVYSQKDIVGSPLIAGGMLVPAIIGSSFGRKTYISNNSPEEVTKGTSPAVDLLKNGNVIKISRVLQYDKVYMEGVHFNLGGDKQSISWITTRMLEPPSEVSVKNVDGSGNPSVNKYYYVVSALNSYGETLSSSEGEIIPLANTTKVKISWKSVSGAIGYKIYRTTTPGSYVSPAYIGQVNGQNVESYEHALSVAPTAGIPLSTATAKDMPAVGSKYQVSYSYYSLADLYEKPKWFYDINQVCAEHGIGSDLAVAAKLAFENDSPAVLLVASSEESTVGYARALETLKGKKVNIVISLFPMDYQLLSFVEDQSSKEERNEMCMITGPSVGMEIGDASTPNTIIYNALGLGNKRAEYIDNWCKVDVQNDDFVYTEKELSGRFLSCAVAGKRAGLGDVTVTLTGKTLAGIKSLGVERLESEMDVLASNGVKVIWSDRGSIKVRHDLTTSLATLEDSESAIVYGDDEMIKGLRDSLEHFIGSKINNHLIYAIQLAVEGFLGQKISDDKIRSYKNLKVEQDMEKRTRVFVSFAYFPMYPCNEIEIRYGLDIG